MVACVFETGPSGERGGVAGPVLGSCGGTAMRAVWITKAGGPAALEVREAADPEPGPGQVLECGMCREGHECTVQSGIKRCLFSNNALMAVRVPGPP